MDNLKRSLFCALDFKDPGDAHKLIEKVKKYIDGVKVGNSLGISMAVGTNGFVLTKSTFSKPGVNVVFVFL